MEHYPDQVPCFCFSCTDDGMLRFVNEPLRIRLGYGPGELEGQKADILFTLPTRIFQQTHFFPLIKMHGHAEEIFISLQTRDRDYVHVLINATRNETGGEACTVYAGIEVRNRKQFEEELIAAKKAAEKALLENTALIQARQELQAHLETLDHQMNLVSRQHSELLQFNKVITHDLREPLRKLSVFANMMLEAPEDAPRKSVVERLLGATAQMRSIVSGLQQYIWLSESPGARELVDPGKVLLAAKGLLQREFPSVDLIIEGTDLPPIHADAAQMQVLFYQLLSNVIRFRKTDEAAFVKLSGYKVQRNRFRHVAGKYDYTGFIRLELADRGVGFNNDYKAQVFDLFRHLHPQSGTGIGLALCRKIAENHQGSIEIEGREGQGATVTLLLPAGVPEPEQAMSGIPSDIH